LTFRVVLASQPKKFIKKLSEPDISRVIKKLDVLSANPLPKGTKVVEGRREKTYRVRVGNIRILYTIFWKEKLVLVSVIDKRPTAYR
jgi:mRNA interferase RelE/StbE